MIISPVSMEEQNNGSKRTCPKTCTCPGAGGSDGSCGGGCNGDIRSSKRLKQKKLPQRGLGVAQLEKIRLEEQQKKCPNLKSSSTNSLSLAPLTLPFFRPPSSVSLPTMSSNGGSSTSSLFKPSPSMPDLNDLCSKALISCGGLDGSWPEKLNGGGFNVHRENPKLDLDFNPINYEANNPTFNFPNLMQRSMPFQQSYPSSMEPPSTQSYFRNKYSPLCQEEEKMVGLKRQYPFSMEIPPAPLFNGKLPSSLVDPFGMSNGSASGSNGSPVNAKPRNHMSSLLSRDPSSSILQAEQNSRNVVPENGDFLTLAPPSAASPNSNGKQKDPHDNSGHSNQDVQKASQELLEDRHRQASTSGTSMVNGQPFFSFLSSPSIGSCDGEAGEKRVDLTLKL